MPTVLITRTCSPRQAPSPACLGPEGRGSRGPGGTCTFVNEAHILLVGRGEDLAAVGGRAGAAVPLAVVDDSGDGGTGGTRHMRTVWGPGGLPRPLPPGRTEAALRPKTHLVIAGSGPHARLPDPSASEGKPDTGQVTSPGASERGGRGVPLPPSKLTTNCSGLTTGGTPRVGLPESGLGMQQTPLVGAAGMTWST